VTVARAKPSAPHSPRRHQPIDAEHASGGGEQIGFILRLELHVEAFVWMKSEDLAATDNTWMVSQKTHAYRCARVRAQDFATVQPQINLHFLCSLTEGPVSGAPDIRAEIRRLSIEPRVQ
jgi:hypothetical protein